MTLLIINKGNYRHQNGKRYKPGEHVRRVIRPALRGHLARPTQLANERAEPTNQTDSTVQHSETVNCELAIGHTWNPFLGPSTLASPASAASNSVSRGHWLRFQINTGIKWIRYNSIDLMEYNLESALCRNELKSS